MYKNVLKKADFLTFLIKVVCFTQILSPVQVLLV